jgi:threonylcarbamoyladenosine tRNA methylthiotransferase MtaB
VRISSIEASQIDERMIDVLNSSSKMCRHLHIPLQAGHDEVLRRMRRKYTTAEYAAKIARIREAMPGVAITTDVIAGFPGETDDMFRSGYRFMEELEFAEMHVFPYSKRTGTPAARMDGQVSEEVKQERVHELIELSERMQLAYARRFVGETLSVIPERRRKGDRTGNMLTGYSDNYLQVAFAGSEDLIGRVCRVRVTEAGVNECQGVLEAESGRPAADPVSAGRLSAPQAGSPLSPAGENSRAAAAVR